MLLNEWYNDVDYDTIETISWQRHLEEDYDEDDDGNPISMMLYNIEMTDSDGNTSYFDNLTEEELADELDNFESGKDIYKSIVNDTKDKGYENPKEFINTTPDNINDINSVIKIASKIWQIVEYVPNSRGYILPNGMLLYFGPNIDHMSISYITGMTIGRFVQLGAIRCGDNSFELACPPTYEQKRSLYKLIGGSKNNDIYVDIVKYDLSQPISNNSRQMKMYPDTICSANYNNNNPKLILNQIDNYFQNGIKLGLSYGMSLRGESKKYNKIYRIVENIVKKQLNEIVSPVVWHFCWLDNLLGILQSNSFKLSKSNVDREQFPGVTGFSSKRPYYFCTTRSKSSSDGYSDLVTNDNQEGFARIQFDGNALNNITHSKASDYFGERGEPHHGKRAFFNAIKNGKQQYLNIHNKENEREDTIWYHKDKIENINKYIQRIDICVPNEESFIENKNILFEIDILCQKLNIPFFFYNNVQDFDKQNTNTMNNKLFNESYLRLTEDEEHSTEKIKPTTEWMTKWYDIMNKRLFNGELGACILRPFTTGKGSNGRTLGWFKITASNIKVERSTRRIFKSDYYSRQYVDRSSFPSICKPCIELNANYSAPEDSWLNTLVHEMCHYYTYMYGYAPKQGHGPEFREIGAIVSSKSNGLITIQRLASAEEMTHFDLDADIKQKNQERLDRKKSKLNVCVIILDNKQVRLVTTTSMKLVDEIANLHNTKNDTLYFGCCHELGLVELLYSKGYRSSMRTYRYWDISNASWLNILPEYQWNKVIGKCATMEEALGLENKDENQPSLAVANNNKQEETHLGYHIIKDGTGYNLYNTETKHKTFGNPVEKIWFDNEQNLFCFKNGKFTFIGTPGHWQKYNVQENINRKNMDENTDKIKEAIRKKLQEMIDEKINGNGEADSISISPDMNLGLESPFEIMQ